MPVHASDIILEWIHDDGYSIGENGWVRALDRKFYFQITAEKDGHRHIARARDREQAVAQLGALVGCPLVE